MPVITDVYAREVLDSRSNPTVEVEVLAESDAFGRTLVPSGAPTSKHKAVKLRDGDKSRYLSKGVTKAVEDVNEIVAPKIIGGELSVLDQVSTDKMMITLDGTPDKGKLGANATLGVPIAVARAAVDLLGQPLYKYLGGFDGKQLPIPMMSIVNGGSHSGAPIVFQEFMTLPVGITTFKGSLRWSTEISHNLKSTLNKRGLGTTVGDGGGFAPKFENTENAVEIIIQVIGAAGYKPGEEVFLGFDCASSEFCENGIYDYSKFEGEHDAKRIAAKRVDYLGQLVDKYPIITIEDGMGESGWNGWKQLTEHISDRVQLVDDDSFVTNTEILTKGIESGIGNSTLIKVNQIGTLTETFDVTEVAQKAGYTAAVSHRLGKTGGTTIADIAVVTNAGQTEAGSLSHTDRIARYSQLLHIEDKLFKAAEYDGIKSSYNSDK